jgi:hypothetical protein
LLVGRHVGDRGTDLRTAVAGGVVRAHQQAPLTERQRRVHHVVRLGTGHRLDALGHVGVGHHLQLPAEDLLVPLEGGGAVAGEEQVGVKAHRFLLAVTLIS